MTIACLMYNTVKQVSLEIIMILKRIYLMNEFIANIILITCSLIVLGILMGRYHDGKGWRVQ